MDYSIKISERLWNMPDELEDILKLIRSYAAWERITCLPKANYDVFNRFALSGLDDSSSVESQRDIRNDFPWQKQDTM